MKGGGWEETVGVKEKERKKLPRVTAKHSALKHAAFPRVACRYQRDRK